MSLESLYKKIVQKPHPRIFSTRSMGFRLFIDISADIYEYILEKTQYLPPNILAEIREKRIIDLVKKVKTAVPFYSKYLEAVQTFDDFKKLPPVAKTRMRMEFEKASIINHKFDLFKIPQFTSGSTGIPFQFYLDQNMIARRIAAVATTWPNPLFPSTRAVAG